MRNSPCLQLLKEEVLKELLKEVASLSGIVWLCIILRKKQIWFEKLQAAAAVNYEHHFVSESKPLYRYSSYETLS